MSDIIVNEVIVSTTNLTVDTVNQDTLVQDQRPAEVTVVTEGIQGPPGVSGNNKIGDYLAEIESPQHGDLISFVSAESKWKNVRRAEITDGGNF